MTIASAAPGHRTPRSLDLKRSLMLRVAAVALSCFLAAAALAVIGTYHELRQANEAVADLVVKQLQTQLWRIESNLDLAARFPDWDAVLDRAQGPGQCVQYLKPDGSVGRSACVGVDGSAAALPAWMSSLGAWLLGAQTEIGRSIAYAGKPHGTLVVSTGTPVVVAAIWKDVSRLLGLTAVLVGAICVLQYAAVGRALRPTRDILAGLDRLARGDLSCRLPAFRLDELQRISEVFNTLAAALDRTLRERTELATRLADGQEQERRHLARELHDELAQSLSAISAGAASIQATAETQCPALAAEADRLAHAALATMRALRGTLESLRPPEIDDFGLCASLAALAREQERRAGGKLRIRFDVSDDLRGLSPTAAGHVYRIVQEGLTNIAKHAQASQARVAIELQAEPGGRARPDGRRLTLSIEDNGAGAAGNGAAASMAAQGSGLGLIGMRERAMALGGQLVVIRSEEGFKLEAVIPLGPPGHPGAAEATP